MNNPLPFLLYCWFDEFNLASLQTKTNISLPIYLFAKMRWQFAPAARDKNTADGVSFFYWWRKLLKVCAKLRMCCLGTGAPAESFSLALWRMVCVLSAAAAAAAAVRRFGFVSRSRLVCSPFTKNMPRLLLSAKNCLCVQIASG